MTAPLVSVVMPVYNADSYLDAAVRSILEQTFSDYEFIIIDDGSTDQSGKMLEGFAARDQRIRLVRRENRGIVPTRNQGLELARGRYLAFMDADDVAMPKRLELQVGALEDNRELVAVGSRVMLVDPDGWPIMEMCTHTKHEEIDGSHIAGTGVLELCNPSVVMRREALLRVGPYRKEFEPAEDIDMFLRLAEIGQLANLPEVLLQYRMHHRSAGHARSEQQRRGVDGAVREARARRGLPPLSPRPSESRIRLGRGQCHRRWAWWALRAGNVRTARKHARLAVRAEPWSMESWRVLACAVRGH